MKNIIDNLNSDFVGSIQILSEKKVDYVELSVDMSESVRSALLKHAYHHILHDEEALLNWAFTDALERGVQALRMAKAKANYRHNVRDRFGRFAKKKKGKK